MDILYQSDNNYAPYMGVSICSLFENNRDANEINVYVINDSIDREHLDKLQDMAKLYNRKVIILDPDALIKDESLSRTFGCTGERWNNHSYLKLLFARMITDDIDLLLYIDCDTAVVGNLSPIFNCKMEGCSIAMVQDSLTTYSKTTIGITDTDRYYNSGVILFNVKKWIGCRWEEKIISHLRDVRVYGTVDQDVLNVVLKNEIFTLPIRYNLQPVYLDYTLKQYSKAYKHAEPYYSDKEVEDAIKNPAILHYLRYLGQSPWHKDSIHPCRKYFDHYLELSPWRDMKRKEGKADTAFRLERLLYKIIPRGLFLKLFHFYHERMISKGNGGNTNHSVEKQESVKMT